MTPLTELVMAYKRSGEGLERIVEELSALTYEFPKQYRGFTEDDAGEFLLFLHPKFPRFIENFCPQGKPFENYFKRCLRWQIKSYANRVRTQRARYRIECCPGLWPDGCVYGGEDSVREESTAYGPGFFEQSRNKPSLADPVKRRLIVLALKECTEMDEVQLERTAVALGISPAWLVAQRDRLEERLRKKDPRLVTLRGRRNSAYATILQVQGELSRCVEPQHRARLEHRLRVHRKRLASARLLLSRVVYRPTNDEIADILGIPKGSVDSTLYYLRNGKGFRHTHRHEGTVARNKQRAQTARI